MSIFKTFQDAAKVAEDVAQVAAAFDNVPAGLYALGKDVVNAVLNRDLSKLTAIKADAQALFATVQADAAGAQEQIAQFNADLDVLLADLSP